MEILDEWMQLISIERLDILFDSGLEDINGLEALPLSQERRRVEQLGPVDVLLALNQPMRHLDRVHFRY